MEVRRAIGIDLGTALLRAAICGDAGVPIAAIGADAVHELPSAVFLLGDFPLVGRAAIDEGYVQPEGLADNVVQSLVEGRCKAFNGEISIPAAVPAALVLRDAYRRLAQAMGSTGFDVALAVASSAGVNHRRALLQAAAMAGFQNVELVNAAGAAVLAWMDARRAANPARDQARQTLLVFDFGAGKLDAAIVRLDARERCTLAVVGDPALGARDFDVVLAGLAAEAFRREHREDPREHPISWGEMLAAAAAARHLLGDASEASLLVEHAGVKHQARISKEVFELEAASLVDRAAAVVESLVELADVSWHEIDGILLVGGATKMPVIANRVRAMAGGSIPCWTLADGALAAGAVLAARLRRSNGTPPVEKRLIDITPFSLGIIDRAPWASTGEPQLMIPRYTPLPARASVVLPPRAASRPGFDVQLIEAAGSTPRERRVLGEIILPRANFPPPGEPIEVAIEFTEWGDLQLWVGQQGSIPAQADWSDATLISSDCLAAWQSAIATGGVIEMIRRPTVTKQAAQAYAAPPSIPVAMPLPPIVVATAAVASPPALPAALQPPPFPASMSVAAGTRRQTTRTILNLAGHASAAVIGLAAGYYALCCLAPRRFNSLNLPIPAAFQQDPLPTDAESESP